jgi:hypothetical protein
VALEKVLRYNLFSSPIPPYPPFLASAPSLLSTLYSSKVKGEGTNDSNVRSILLLGDGDLSFSLALKRLHRKKLHMDSSNTNSFDPNFKKEICLQLFGTSLETEERLASMYNAARKNIEEFLMPDAYGEYQTIFSLDVSSSFGFNRGSTIDFIIFNFPYADVLKDKEKNLFGTYWIAKQRHVNLLRSVFKKSKSIPESSVIVTLLMSQAFSWDVEKIAYLEGFKLTQIFPFDNCCFSQLGYTSKRSFIDQSFKDENTKNHSEFISHSWSLVFISC